LHQSRLRQAHCGLGSPLPEEAGETCQSATPSGAGGALAQAQTQDSPVTGSKSIMSRAE